MILPNDSDEFVPYVDDRKIMDYMEDVWIFGG